MAKCDCFEKNLSIITEKLRTELPDGATEFEVSWTGAALFFSGDYVPVNPEVNYQYRAMKTNQTPAKNLTKKTIKILCSYCPFCGRELDEGAQ